MTPMNSSELYVPHNCAHCSQIIIERPSLLRHDTYRCRLQYSKAEAYRAAKDGCSVYKLLVAGLRAATTREHARLFLRAVQGKPDVHLPRVGVRGADLNDRILYLAETMSERPFQIAVHKHQQAVFTVLGWGSFWFQINAYPDDPASSTFSAPPINRNVGSICSIQLARKWLYECAEHGTDTHQLCGQVVDIHFTPTRLLRIEALDDSFRLRLHESSLNHEQFRYAALSYCWGGDQPVKTTTDTMAQRKVNINYSSLPRTLQDAVYVTHQLGLHYIWIDCLSIVQDDPSDLALQLPQMPNIYKNAFVTISASSATTCFEGFLDTRRPAASALCEDVVLRYRSKDVKEGNVYLFENTAGASSGPIDKRAWTLQEWKLSPRLLNFATDQMKWLCPSRQYFDGGYHSHHYDDVIGQNKRSASTIERTTLQDWAEVLDSYTQRALSDPGDKLIALAALASEVGEARGLIYLAGMWKEHLEIQLLWRLWDKPVKRPAQYRAPTWSWASVDSWAMFERETSDRVAITIVDVTIELVDRSFIYGPVKSGLLVVEGRVISGEWFVNKESTIVLSGLDIDDEDLECSDDGYSDEDMTDIDDELDADRRSSSHDSESIEDSVGLNGVDLTADAIESNWDTTDPYFTLNVNCLQILAQGSEEGAAGLLLLPSGSAAYKRVGHFYFDRRKKDVFFGVLPQTICII
ncbi:heterokaryon incompatibility protein-domain-containing protein [Lophiotrema nucula]|uniref:Heterokaryon incompatibility protein-domain-containing protein n=1 Tax=Lophiotrema nucula TaxID=690887 RepID=A0A6A5YVR5_9PLEO|nr:heterokaryon incompatibility protein-domain-containing protein [Lophiotrema nucula]